MIGGGHLLEKDLPSFFTIGLFSKMLATCNLWLGNLIDD
jgi:hypothetical protein